MTREEAIRTLKEHKITFQHDNGWATSTLKAIDMAIEALSAEPCDDCISREQAIKECFQIHIDGETFDVVQVETLMGVPSVQPVSAIEEIKAEIIDKYISADGSLGTVAKDVLRILDKHTSREGDK